MCTCTFLQCKHCNEWNAQPATSFMQEQSRHMCHTCAEGRWKGLSRS